jgi:hypothetical protein
MNSQRLCVGDFGEDVACVQEALAKHGIEVSPDERKRRFFGPTTREAVGTFQKKFGIEPTCEICESTAQKLAATPRPSSDRNPTESASGVVAATAAARNQAVATVTDQIGTVAGRLYQAGRAGFVGLEVRLVDKGVGPDTVLAQSAPTVDGSYTVTYQLASLRRRGKLAPDLQIQIYTGGKLLGASDVRYNADLTELLNVSLPDSAFAFLPSELDALHQAVAPHYQGRLADLKEDDTRSDVTYLANKTGWDARVVALGALADQFSQSNADHEIPAAWFYALFRAGMPANADALFRADANTLSTVWSQAVAQGVIPLASKADIPAMLKRFQALGATVLLTKPAIDGAAPLSDILALNALQAQDQQRFAQLYAAHSADKTEFWRQVVATFGQARADQLQTHARLAFLTLNNVKAVQAAAAIGDSLALVRAGYHRQEKWIGLLKEKQIPVPPQIPGEGDAKLANYAGMMAAQLRLGHPTAAVAELVSAGDLPLAARKSVAEFLTAHQGKFEIGMQSVTQFMAANKLAVPVDTLEDLKRLQRVYQITPSDHAAATLLREKLDSAYHIAQYEADAFRASHADKLGGAAVADEVHRRATHVHGTVLNIAISYLTARNGINLGAQPLQIDAAAGTPGGQVLQPAPKGPAASGGADVIAYPTLDTLFGSMDFCSCEACRSILSPAAYLVNLLQFIDRAANGKENAQAVLFERRPDLQYLPLTCENTNTPLPYIDIVNETLEYYAANAAQPLTLTGYKGHDTGAAATEDLMAAPQYVMDTAYLLLQGEWFPPPLPFHQPLEALRGSFDAFKMPLALAMERLRKGDALERGTNPYGWRDILMERLRLSRPEYRLLTDGTLTQKQIYGFDPARPANQVADALANAKSYANRVGVSNADLVSLLLTRFINPDSDLVPRLERLGVSFATMQALHDGALSDADFLKLLPSGADAPDPADYGGDIVAWIKTPAIYARIMGIIVLTDPTGSTTGCSFDKMELRHAKPVANAADTTTRLTEADYVRLLRFIRLWRKTGWSIQQTDAAICSLFKADLSQVTTGDIDTVAKLDAGFPILLPRLGVLSGVIDALGLEPPRDLMPLLACWSDIVTHGDDALYRHMFLNPAVLRQDTAFAANSAGDYLTDVAQKLFQHAEALRGAFNLTADEFDRITAALSYDGNTGLTLTTISAVFRRAWLARRLRVSVRELLLFIQMAQLDPFAPPDIGAAPAVEPSITQLIALVRSLQDRSVKSGAALYLIWNQDLSGKSAPTQAQVTGFARTLRADFAAIEDEFKAVEDPGGDVLRARMTLVFGQDDADAFFALLDGTLVSDVPYTHPAPALEPPLLAADPQLAYDGFRHRLSHTGVMSTAVRDWLKAVAGTTAAFKAAVDALYARGQDALAAFFSRYPDLRPLYDAYKASPDPVPQKRTALLAAFQPELSRRRKREQAVQRLSDAGGFDLPSTGTLLDAPATPYPLYADGQPNRPALDDVLALETPGMAAQFFFRDTATGAVGLAVAAVPGLDYAAASNPLPPNPVAGGPVSGIWTGSLEIPEAGYYNLVIETDAADTPVLNLAGQNQPLVQNGTVWRNANPLRLATGPLYAMTLTVEKLGQTLSLRWEAPKRPGEVIPGRYLYPPSILPPFTTAYVRFLKIAALATTLGLSSEEMAWFGTNTDYRIGGDGWFNVLPVAGDPPAATAAALRNPFIALLDYATIKAAWAPGDPRLLSVLQDPAGATAQADSLLFTLSGWDRGSSNDLLAHFGLAAADLAHFNVLRRVWAAFEPVKATAIPAVRLLAATTNDPAAAAVRDLQSALRARYDAADWREIVKPINDPLRGLQRDALVAYILRRMTENPTTSQINTPDKLFEYFLMDVEMDACMGISRIRHALSSVQLFAERCLRNLEPRVSPGSINAAQWVWMKRYRVWEANRKVFLFPENWLEPELRDEKSPFFKEIESDLLQSDITDDVAESALLKYLSRLHDVARLSPAGMFYQEGNAGTEDDVVHLIAHSAGALHYYYRRYEYGYWTAWDRLKLDIEADPVIPVVWNGRLLLFWLRILKQTPQALPDAGTPAPGEQNVAALTMTAIRVDAKKNADANALITMQAVLCWSEYYNGQWQEVKTSDVNQPAWLGNYAPTGASAFDRSTLMLRSNEITDGLLISIRGVANPSGFLLYNTHSLPLPHPAAPVFHYGYTRGFETASSRFSIDYLLLRPEIQPTWLTRDVLTDSIPYNAIQPNHTVSNIWVAPLTFEDRRHVFYVTSTQQPVWIPSYIGIGVTQDPGPIKFPIVPGVVAQPYPVPIPRPWGDPVSPGFGVIDPLPVERLVAGDPYIRQGLATAATITYGNRQIGPIGAITAPIDQGA